MAYTLESLLNTRNGMEVIRNNVKNDDGTDSVTGVEWFTYNGNVASTIYVSGNNWIGFGTSSEQLKICSRDGAVYYVYRQEDTLESGVRFLKLRVEGYTYYSSKSDSYKLIYEVFLFDDGCIFLNVIQTPTNSSYLGTSSIYNGTNKEILDITTGVAESSRIEITIENAGNNNQEVIYERYPVPDLASVSVAALSKTEYFIGDLIDRDTLTVVRTDVNGNAKEVKNYSLSGFDSSTAGEKTVTVTYRGLSCDIQLTVIEDSASSISGVSMQYRYVIGEPVLINEITVRHLSGKEELVDSGYTVSGFDSETAGDKTITISYEGVSIEQTVNISENAFLSVENPETSYAVGISSFKEPSVSITYDDGETEYVSAEFSGFDNSKIGTCTITVSARGLSTTYDVQITDILTANIGAENETDIVATLNLTTGILNVQGTGDTKEITQGSLESGGLFGDGGAYAAHVKESVFGEGITGIYGVCRDMSNLTKVTLPESLNRIGDYSFYCCAALTEITIHENITHIGNMAFKSCESMTMTILSKNCEIYEDSSALDVRLIKGHAGATAQEYAIKYGKVFEMLETIVAIEISSLPSKTEYFTLGKSIDTSGLQISGTTDDGQTVKILGYSVKDVDMSEPGQKTVTVSLGDLTTQYDITVKNPSFDEINDTTDGMTYGEYKGKAPWFMFDGKEAKEISCLRGYISFNGWSPAIKIVGGSTSFTSNNECYVMETILDNGIRVLKFRERFYTAKYSEYYVDHETFFFSTGDIYINITHMPYWSNSSDKGTLTSNSYTYSMNLKSETITQKAFYHKDSSGLDWTMKTEAYSFPSTPQKIIFSTLPQTDYFKGDTFSMEGAVVLKVYGDGTTEETTSYTINAPNMTSAGIKQATVVASGITSVPLDVYVNVNDNIGYPTETDVVAITDIRNGTLTISGSGATKDFTYSNRPSYCSVQIYLKELIIDPQITRLGSHLFYELMNIKKISSLDNIEEIETYAFDGCSSLTVELSLNNVIRIGYNAFYGSGITKINIGSKIQEIGTHNFTKCKKLEEIHIEKYENKLSGAPWGDTSAIVTWIANMIGIEITRMPDKVDYLDGDTLNTSGLEVSESYSDGYKEVIPDGYTVSDLDSSTAGEKEITVTYGEYITSFVVVVRYTIIGILISRYPAKKYYKAGDNLDTAGMKVVLINNRGKEIETSDYNVSDLDTGTMGIKTVKVSCEVEVDESTTAVYFDEFTVIVTSDGENPFEDENERIDITIHWPNGEFDDLTNNDIASGSVTLQESICNDRYFIWGGCVSNQLTFITHSRQFLSTEEHAYPHGDIEVYVECKGTKIKIFTGTIDSGDREGGLIKRKIIAYDRLYKLRNTDIAWWYKNLTTDKQMILTQKQFRDLLFEHLGIEQVESTLEYDDALVPDTANANEMNAVNIIKDMCLQNSVFGWMNRDGKFEYLTVKPNSRLKSTDLNGNLSYEYFEANAHFDTYESCNFREGRIWYPKEFLADPYPGLFSPGGLTAQEAYENNVYYNRNSFFVGNQDWLDRAFQADEYGVYTVSEPIMPICHGITTKWDNQHLYRAQQYNAVVRGNPMNMVGDTIEIMVRKTAEDGTELQWIIHSYIMSRTLKILGDTGITDTYSANNAPYNGNNRQIGKDTPELSATLFRTRQELPVISYRSFSDGASAISDDGTVEKDKLRNFARISRTDYDNLPDDMRNRTDTIFATFKET